MNIPQYINGIRMVDEEFYKEVSFIRDTIRDWMIPNNRGGYERVTNIYRINQVMSMLLNRHKPFNHFIKRNDKK